MLTTAVGNMAVFTALLLNELHDSPERIRPRMETLPVKGHFLSMYVPSIACKKNQLSVLGQTLQAVQGLSDGGEDP